MREAEDRQPRHAGKMDVCDILAFVPRAFDDQHHAGSEQDGEQAAHLAVDENKRQRPDDDVGGVGAAIDRRAGIGHFRHRKADDIHQQYAHHRKAAQGIKLEIARGVQCCGHALAS